MNITNPSYRMLSNTYEDILFQVEQAALTISQSDTYFSNFIKQDIAPVYIIGDDTVGIGDKISSLSAKVLARRCVLADIDDFKKSRSSALVNIFIEDRLSSLESVQFSLYELIKFTPINIFMTKESHDGNAITSFINNTFSAFERQIVFIKEDNLNILDKIFQDRNIDFLLVRKAALCMEDHIESLDVKLKHEDALIKMRKQQVYQEKQLITRQGNQSGSQGINILRNNVSQRLTQLEQSIDQKYKHYFDPHFGTLTIQLEQYISEMTTLDESKTSKNFVYTIPEKTRVYILENIRFACRDIADSSASLKTNLLEIIHNEMLEILSSYGVNNTLDDAFRFESLATESIIQQVNYSDKKYEGTLNKKKPMEYVMGARMYYMMLFMILSMLGATSVIRGADFKKYFTPILIILVGFGGYQIYMTRQKEKEETMSKNLENAQEHLRQELSRLPIDFYNTLKMKILDAMKTQSHHMLGQTEEIISQKEKQSKSKLDVNRQNWDAIERQIDVKLRSIEEFQRSKTKFLKDIKKVHSDLDVAMS